MEQEETNDRADELMAISSIYGEDVFLPSEDDYGGQFVAKLKLPQPFMIHFQDCDDEVDADQKSATNLFEAPAVEKFHQIGYLPPIVMNFQLPESYPSTSAPIFTLSCKWLSCSQLDVLCKRLDQVWEESAGMVVLFLWFDVLENETFDLLHLEPPLNLSNVIVPKKEGSTGSTTTRPSSLSTDHFDDRGIQDIASQDLLLSTILEYDRQESHRQFSKSSITCEICFCDKLGCSCSKFDGCEHVFCKECMKEYFTVQIKSGNITGLQCPADKCDSKVHPAQVKSLVEPEVFSRYDYLLLQVGLQTMADIVYCPRPACGQPVILEREYNIGNCPNCYLVFCSLCMLTYHGVSSCKIKNGEHQRLKDEYLNADAAMKLFLEKRYGKKTLQRAVDESFSQEWLAKFSKPCPQCNTNIQKIDGCNKMTCTKCRAFFCWLCMQSLPRNSPYLHFSSPNSLCFNRLFEGIEPDADFVDSEEETDDED